MLAVQWMGQPDDDLVGPRDQFDDAGRLGLLDRRHLGGGNQIVDPHRLPDSHQGGRLDGSRRQRRQLRRDEVVELLVEIGQPFQPPQRPRPLQVSGVQAGLDEVSQEQRISPCRGVDALDGGGLQGGAQRDRAELGGLSS